ncbi:retrovirus-related pol polyprotein from transposon TNT 1-94 [Tanacetum coccineum]
MLYALCNNDRKLTDALVMERVVQIVLWYLDSGCSKHMTGNHSQLTNFVHKFLGTPSQDDLCITDALQIMVKLLRSKDEALEFIIKFLQIIQVRLNATVRNIRIDNRTEFVNQTLHSYYENVGKLKAKADVGIFIGYAPAKKAYRIYNRHTRRIMETIHVDFDELTTMDSEQSSSGPALHEMTPGTPSSGLVPHPPSPTPFVPPTRIDWDTLFQPLFDEYFNPPPSVDHHVLEVAAPEPVVSTSLPSSTSVDQDAPSPSTL